MLLCLQFTSVLGVWLATADDVYVTRQCDLVQTQPHNEDYADSSMATSSARITRNVEHDVCSSILKERLGELVGNDGPFVSPYSVLIGSCQQRFCHDHGFLSAHFCLTTNPVGLKATSLFSRAPVWGTARAS
ncbi:unnamed protein product [Ilex paraguariensis]|uniref:Secreted protein n=1 Tax=Ilex paraguariensis TaxID=185542 RepID=A0ABC8V203_9AQUA